MVLMTGLKLVSHYPPSSWRLTKSVYDRTFSDRVKYLTTSLTLRTKILNKKQNTRTEITAITNQYFRKFIKEFKNLTYLGYKKKHVNNEPTDAYYAKKATWKLLHAYINAHSQILIDEYTGDRVHTITRLQPQCENMTFSGQSRYTRLFQKVIHKGGESAINHIKIF